MNNLSPRGMVVTERDRRIFRYLFVNKVATNWHLQQDIFEGASKQAVHRRMDKLIASRLIEVSYQRGNGNRLVYSLSKNALEKFIASKRDLKRRQGKSNSISHDLGLLEIKRALNGLGIVKNYYSENLLRSGLFDDNDTIREIRAINPDAIIEVTIDDRQLYFTLEYEASSKFGARYDKLVNRYYQMDEVAAVLFVSKNATIQKKVVQAEKKICQKGNPKMFYCLYDNLTRGKQEVQFINFKSELLLLTGHC